MSPKKALIISPYFAPSNAAEMHRIRTSLPYFREFGWEVEVVCVKDSYSEMVKDELLLLSIPADIKFHYVEALSKKYTSKVGLGSLALRSMWYYRKKVNQLLKSGDYRLIYFSTTQFPVCILGTYWKKRFDVPFVIDMQDPWHSDYYEDKPKDQRPPKYWFSYRLNKYLEPVAMKKVDGLISVSQAYIDDLKGRYRQIENIPSATLTFGAFEQDIEIATDNAEKFTKLLSPETVNIVYMGRGGLDMHKALTPVFNALKKGLENEPEKFKKLKLYFIGTSYAPGDKAMQTIAPLAIQSGVGDSVVEIPNRVSYYHTLATLKQADALLMPGSDDPNYTASKIYPYLLAKKPLLAIFNPASSAIGILKEYGTQNVYDYETVVPEAVYRFLSDAADCRLTEPHYHPEAVEKYSARQMTKNQCLLFDKVLNRTKNG